MKPKFSCTDTGNVARLIQAAGSKFRYVETWERYMVWDGKRWMEDPRGTRVLGLTKAVAASLRKEADEVEAAGGDGAKLRKWRQKCLSAGRRKAMVELARAEEEVLARPKDFDANRMLFTTGNGTIDLATGTLRPWNKADMLTQAAEDVIYVPGRTNETWDNYLADILPDPDVRRFFQTFIGYCLTGSVKERKIVVCYGLGRNGKSVLLRVLYKLLGPYAGTIRPDMLLVRGGDPHPAEEAALLGKRLVVTSEIEKGRRFDASKVKALTGGDIRAARRMHENFWDLEPTAKIIVATNHKPTVSDASDSFWDRMCLVPFKVRIADAKVDKDLMEKLFADLPSILNWAVEGTLRWVKEGLVVPDAVRESSAEYRAAEDKMADFLAECLEFTCLGKIANRDVIALAKDWCSKNGLPYAFSDKAVGDRLLEAGAVRAKTNGARIWRGVQERGKKAEHPAGQGHPGHQGHRSG